MTFAWHDSHPSLDGGRAEHREAAASRSAATPGYAVPGFRRFGRIGRPRYRRKLGECVLG